MYSCGKGTQGLDKVLEATQEGGVKSRNFKIGGLVSDKYFNTGILIGIEEICGRMVRDGYTQWASALFHFSLFLFN